MAWRILPRQPNICTFRTPGLRQVKAQRAGNSGDYFQVLQRRTGADPASQLFENQWPAILCPSLDGVIETCCNANYSGVSMPCQRRTQDG